MRILFAIGNRNAEDYLQTLLEDENKKRKLNDEPTKNYEFVGYAVHKDNIIELIKTKGPDVIVLREGLDGFKNIPPGSVTDEVPEIFTFAKTVKRMFPALRIVFLAGQRVVGDKNLGNLVAFNIYDILVGSTLNIADVAKLIDNPNKFEDVSKYLPTDTDIIEDFEVEEKEDKEKGSGVVSIDEKEFIISEESVPIEKEKIEAAPQGDVVIVAGADSNNGPAGKAGSLLDNLLGKKAKTPVKPVETNPRAVNPDIPKDPLANLNKPINKDKGLFNRNPGTSKRPQVRNRDVNIYTGKDKIVTFYGAKNGIGTTLLSFSIAMELALRKNKVLYIEYNDTNPMIAYWLGVYEATNYEDGIDRAILGYETNSLKDANDAITTNENLIKGSADFSDIFKKYPPTLDMLFFSESYLLRRDKEPISSTSFTQLLLYYMQQLNYNYIIADVKSSSNISVIEKALTFSNKNYVVINQEVSSLGYCKQFFDVLNRKGLDFVNKTNGNRSVADKNNFIINRYSNRVTLDERGVRDWLDTKKTFTVPENSEEINELSFKCYPIVLYSKNRLFRDSISSIASDIEKL